MNTQNMPDFQAKLSRHSHDTSAGYTATIAPGIIVPQYYDILSPNDSVYFDTYAWTRLKDVVTAFLGEVEVHIDYFFVPLQMMYTPFGQIFFQTNDYVSGMFNTPNNRAKNGRFPLAQFDVTDFELGITYNWNSECFGKQAMRLLDALGQNPMAVLNMESQEARRYEDAGGQVPGDIITENPAHTPWLECAYQAIYQNFYRNDDIERRDLSLYNFDRYFTSANNMTNQALWSMHCHQRKSDYFTTVKVSPIYSAVNSHLTFQDQPVDAEGGLPNNVLSEVRSYLGYAGGDVFQSTNADNKPSVYNDYGSEDDGVAMKNQTSLFNSDNSDLNVASLRTLFAVDKFLRVYGRAGKTYDDQVLAHFGFKVPHDVKHQITHLKHYKFSLQTSPVYANGAGDDVVLGQVGGQGVSEFRSSKTEKFTAPVHGVFMACMYCLTKPRYYNTFDKLNTLNDRLAFPIPEFDKLGMQPLYTFEAARSWLHVTGFNGHTMDKRLGWQFRYNEFKQKYSRVSTHFMGSDGDFEQSTQSSNVYNAWAVARSPFNLYWSEPATDGVLNMMALNEQPWSLNNVMVQSYTEGWSDEYFLHPWEVFQSDPIITEFFCHCKKVSFMSPTGEPDL